MTQGAFNHQPILVADDEENFRHSVVSVLEERGFQTIEANCGLQASQAAQEYRFKLCLLDVHLPDMTGIEVVQNWLKAGITLPVAFMSAEANPEIRRKASLLGALAVLDKPFGLQEIIQLIQQVSSLDPDYP